MSLFDDPSGSESALFYRHVIDSTVDGFFMIDTQRRFIEVNDRLCELFGYAREEVLGKTPLDFVTEESRAELFAQFKRVEMTEHRRYQLIGRRKDGSVFPILLNNTTHRNRQGEVVGSFGFVTDLTPIVAAQHAVADSERELRRILDNLQDTYYRADSEGRVVRISPSVEQLLGMTAEECIGQNLADWYFDAGGRTVLLKALQDSGGRVTGFEAALRHKDGHPVWVMTNAQYVRDDAGNILGVEGVVRDISGQRLAQARIDFLAHHDVLTELPNRLLFKDRFERAMIHAQRARSRAALLFVDLDRFKEVNDLLGHPAGDLLLCETARRIESCVRDTDTVCRHGGDEFLVALTDVRSNDAIARVARTILDVVARPYRLDSHEVAISSSIGIAIYPDDGDNFDSLLRKADSAMYRAKDAGRNTYRYVSEQMNMSTNGSQPGR